MDKIRLPHRHCFLNVWLIAFACQSGQLLSQIENAYDPSYTYQESYQNQWGTPQGISSDQIQTIIYPENSQRYTSPEPYDYSSNYSQPVLEPQNGHWPAFSSNEWEHQHCITFDPLLEEAPDKEQHPLTMEGEAKTYHFENDFPDEPISSPINQTPSPKTLAALEEKIDLPKKEEEEKKVLEKIEEQETNQEKKTPPNLSEGRGNVKIIKKRSELPSPTHRLEEALHQPEEVIGKVIINEPLIGIKDDLEKPHLSEEKNSARTINEKEPPIRQNSILPPNPPETFNRGSGKEEIAQSTPLLNTPPNAPLSPQQESQEPTAPRPPRMITPTTPDPDSTPIAQPGSGKTLKEISINFNNVAMVEYIRFISRISNKNFIFDDEDLQFNVTIVSEEPTTIDNLMAALLQELRIRDLSLLEQANNIIIHRNPRVRSPARIVTDENKMLSSYESELVTRVFRLNTLDPLKASEIIRPLLSDSALIEVLRDTNNLIITDLVINVNKIAQLIGTLDAPNSGVTIGQYVVRNAFVDSLVDLSNKILQPIAQGNPFVLVPHPVSNSIYIVSNSFIVEKALAILQNLDLNEGQTKILSLENLQPSYENSQGRHPSQGSPNNLLGVPARGDRSLGGSYGIFPNGSGGGPGRFGPGGDGGFGPGGVPGDFGPGGTLGGHGPGGAPAGSPPGGQVAIPSGVAESFSFGGLSTEGRFTPPPIAPPPSAVFIPGGIGVEGRPSAIFNESRSFLPGGIGNASRWANELPVGHIERTLFFIYKLRYRKGDNIEIALRKIANSLQLSGTTNVDLIGAINSSQWIESSNALIFTGTATALEKVRELILEVDIPLRQVFIEMLILDTTVDDSLSYSVDWINRSGGGTTTAEQGFLEAVPGSGIASSDNFLSSSETIFSPANSVIPPAPAIPLPVASGFLNSGGFVAGVIGTHLTHNGTQFSSIGALVRAIHSDTKADIVLNPKIITEDNNPAEIFVGGTDRYKTQSITNDLGSLVTNNFQFIDVGTTLRVTPLIGNNGIITLEIIQETTNEAAQANTGGNNQDVNLVPVLTKTRTVTKIHVPNGFFVILSGMIKNNELRRNSRIPCLGGIPIVGCIGKTQTNIESKRNLMIFIRPLIIESDEDYEDITRRQQDVFRDKTKTRRSWNYEIDEALNFGNIRSMDPDDMDCSINERQQR